MLYERLVKKFQTVDERTEEGKAKGYGRTLEASLIRGETTLAHISPNALDQPPLISTNEQLVENTWDNPAADRQAGLELWRSFLEERFVHGRDEDFDYSLVDEDAELDVLERREAEEEWFEDEEPEWVDDDGDVKVDEERKGETGIQDY